ncbi:Mediator complex subunit 13 [Hyphodiscus hymeniophilus]|uniref:Mediator of RNA polymerase II transcription subunit 13 n=1 Tax=Hyphodiscus hymeniophilus TaxID=353542 RepID=A0A9P6VDE2_9HELO|nr:Mediator complex subunit 13 [Hyphodiscus hymeniophilus]
MEPGEYTTNVLSSNSYASIQYEYYEPRVPSRISRKHLQKVEAIWRQDGSLVHLDSFRDGIWVFRSAAVNSITSAPTDPAPDETSAIVEIQGHELLMKDKGTYEPATLARAKQTTSNNLSNLSATSVNSSPSSSFENHFRSGSDGGMRRSQPASSPNILTESPLPSIGAKPATTPGDASPDLKVIHECFISAALESIVYTLCHGHGFIPLNSRTLISRTPNDPTAGDAPISYLISKSNALTLATLDISLTSLGALVLKAYSDNAPGLQCLATPSDIVSDIPPGTALWLAPGGNAAKFYGTQEEKSWPSNMPISQLQNGVMNNRQHAFNGATIQSWKAICLDWLSAKGLNTAELERGGWILVQAVGGSSPYFNAEYQGNPILEELTIVPWPVLLCFQSSSNVNDDLQYSSVDTASRDPLSFAEEWFLGKDERAGVSAKRQKERLIAEAKLKEQADVEARNLQSATYSPVALRRGSNAGAMYPTPPDAPHQPIGATPSFDGQVSTPGNPNQLFPNDVAATPQNASNGPLDVEADIWGSSSKKERSNTSMNFNDNDNDNDLFGDIGGDPFGDVTDADFSFFDVPDAERAVQGSISAPATTLFSHDSGSSMVVPRTDPQDGGAIEETDVIMKDLKTTDESVPHHENKETKMHPPSIRREIAATDHKKASANIEKAPAPSPPFNKEAVFNRLVTKTSEVQGRRSSIFNKVNFEPSMLSVDEKYVSSGRFNFPTEAKLPKRSGSPSLPTTEYLSQRAKIGAEWSTQSLTKVPREQEQTDPELIDTEPMLYILDPQSTSQTSEQDDASHTSEGRYTVLNPGVKRKWSVDNDGGNDMASSFHALAVDYEQSVGTPLSINGSQMPFFDGDPADWSLTTYFTSPEPDVQSNSLSDMEYIAAAQILADQAVSSTVKMPRPASRVSKDEEACNRRSSSTRELLHTVTKAAKTCFKSMAVCKMQSLLEIQGIPVLNQGLRLPPRPMLRGAVPDPSRSNKPFPIPPPQLEIRRSDSSLSILPSAINFWENLGLGPSKGNKDVSAVCVYPNFEGIAENASTFLDQMRSVYESFRLGNHERVVAKDLVNSLLHFTVDSAQPTNPQDTASLKQGIDTLNALKETMVRLSKIISTLSLEDRNIVIYFIYPLDNATLLVHICTAFQHLFNLYRRAISEKKIKRANELVLQLVPLDFVASPISVTVPLPSEYARLAMEVYDRCINFSSASSAPAILLEQPLPKSIDFKMSGIPSASVLQENSCLHIAYAQSIDDRWITAAWTDNRGTQQMSASYCLGRKNEPISMPFSEVANEIWETTMNIISAKKIHWRVMITRIGVMDPSEIEFWAGLHSTESEAQINLTLITVQTDPSLRFLPPSVTLSPISNTAQSVITPVSTPQAIQSSIVSPDQSQSTPPSRDAGGSAATPGENPAEPDADARLIDYTDQSWGAVLAHRLNNSNSLLELVPALISGYLIKRGGTNLDDPPIVMEGSWNIG